MTPITLETDSSGRPILWACHERFENETSVSLHSTQALAQAALKRKRDLYLADDPDRADGIEQDAPDHFYADGCAYEIETLHHTVD